MTIFLKTLLLLSAAGTACGIFLVLLRIISKGKIPNSFLYIAWVIVILRFAVPVNGLIPVNNTAEEGKIQETIQAEDFQNYLPGESNEIIVDSSYHYMEQTESYNFVPEETSQYGRQISQTKILFVVWCCGTLCYLLWNTISYLRFSKSLGETLQRPTRHDIEVYDEVCSSRKPLLKRSEIISVPLTFGIISPVLVIPDIEYRDCTLKNIFSHEIIHFKRCDILLKWITLFAFSMHWFNPFTWYFRREIDKVCELSCDEILLKKMNTVEKHNYGETLITIAENSCRLPSRMVTGFSEGKKDLKERLLHIMSFKKKSTITIAIALVSVLILIGCALMLGPKAGNAADGKTINVSNVDEFLAAVAPGTEIHMAEGTYNLTKASDYGRDGASKYYHWDSCGFDGEYELCIENVDGLKVTGDHAEILTVPRSSNVLVFKKCDGLSLTDLMVGHTEEAQACEGGVIKLENCAGTNISRCRLYGCGTIGIMSEGSNGLNITDTDIYHCSATGIYFAEGREMSVDQCRIYDCGAPESNMEAVGALLLYNASDVTVKDCEVSENYLQYLVQGRAKNVEFFNLRVHDNHINNVFSFQGNMDFNDMTFAGNTVDNWIDEIFHDGTITIDEKKVTEDDLSKMWGEQLSSSGIAAAEADYLTIDRSGTNEIHIKTADEFVASIASDTTIYIDVPQIDLTECSDYGEGASDELWKPDFGNNMYVWYKCYDGYELCIGNVSNFHIVGGEIITQPRYANVLNYISCSNVTLENVKLGHSPEQGQCMGGVLNIEKSEGIILENCDLYGCGILGISARDVKNIHVQNTLIHDCSFGAATLEETDSTVFLGCVVVNCPEPHFSLQGCNDFIWDNKLMDPYCSFNVSEDKGNIPASQNSDIDFLDDEFHDRETAALAACIIADAYFKGNPEVIWTYVSKSSDIKDISEVKIYDGEVLYETAGGMVSSEISNPETLIDDLSYIEGLKAIEDNEEDGTMHVIEIHYTQVSPEYETNCILYLDLIREEGCWRLASLK